MAKQEKKAKPRRRYGIGEWYGKLFTTLGKSERISLAEMQFRPKKERQLTPCPFRSTSEIIVPCTKEGGVCTLRLYELNHESNSVAPVQGQKGELVTTCPHRFQELGIIYQWIGQTLLGHERPVVVAEVGFLEQVGEEKLEDASSEDVGRIDSVLVHPNLGQLSWCALEVQAVYFSGNTMRREFEELRVESLLGLPFPSAHRRPDFRSSGPKRLMPQLQIKVPTLRRWGKKMAVLVDRPFFDSLGKMEDVKDVSNCDIAWFVVRYDESGGKATLTPNFVKLTTLENAVEGLTGGSPVTLTQFEARMREKLDPKR